MSAQHWAVFLIILFAAFVWTTLASEMSTALFWCGVALIAFIGAHFYAKYRSQGT